MDLVPDPQMLHVNLANRHIAEDSVSTCPLLTPSPPTNALVDPTSEPQEPGYFVPSGDLVAKLKQVEDEPNPGDSTSTNSSTTEPASTQLLNHNHYHHLIKTIDDVNLPENGVKQPPLQLTCGKAAEDYFFMDWNWTLIRKSCLWIFMSVLVASVGLVIAMVVTLPRTCNPPVMWYQGSLMYEIFPASFQDTNADGIGDLKGIAERVDYIHSLGVKAVRLNSIFPAHYYPEDYNNVTSLVKIEKTIGTMNDFAQLVYALHSKNISLVLDFPLYPVVRQLKLKKLFFKTVNKSETLSEYIQKEEFVNKAEFLDESDADPISTALDFWIRQGVDGFYLKGLEHFVNSEHFGESIKNWKLIIGNERCLIINYNVLELSPESTLSIIMNRIDLIDVKLDLETGTDTIRTQIESITNSSLFSNAGAPWVHWSIGDVETNRLASRLIHGNATLGATLLQLMLPGTQNLFYGDEIGLRDVSDPEGEREDIKHLHQLAPMRWAPHEKQFTRGHILPWIHGMVLHSSFSQRSLVARMAKLRQNSPAVYINTVEKDGVVKANAEVKYSRQGIIVIQRWYPRRNSFVVISNLGLNKFESDLSKMYYGGKVVVGPRPGSVIEAISFKDISLWPGESVVIELD